MAGEGSFDYKNYLQRNDSLVPGRSWRHDYGLTPSDVEMVDVFAQRSGRRAVGRIPAVNATQLGDYITTAGL